MFDRVLVPLDGSTLAECVLPHVVALARVYGSEIMLLHVLERTEGAGQPITVDPLTWHISKAEARAYLDQAVTRLQEGGVRATPALLEGPAARSILEYADDQEADLIVLSSHGRSGLSGWNVSSVAQQIILRARRSVLIIRAYQPMIADLTSVTYQRVVVPLDCSQRAESVLPVVSALARAYPSQVILIHAVRQPEMLCREPLSPEDLQLVDRLMERNWQEATEYLQQVQSRLPGTVETRLLKTDNTAAALHELVERENADLLILSAHGRSGTTRWPYGSLVVSFIAYGTVPLLIVQDLAPGELELSPAEIAAQERTGH